MISQMPDKICRPQILSLSWNDWATIQSQDKGTTSVSAPLTAGCSTCPHDKDASAIENWMGLHPECTQKPFHYLKPDFFIYRIRTKVLQAPYIFKIPFCLIRDKKYLSVIYYDNMKNKSFAMERTAFVASGNIANFRDLCSEWQWKINRNTPQVPFSLQPVMFINNEEWLSLGKLDGSSQMSEQQKGEGHFPKNIINAHSGSAHSFIRPE